MGAADSLARCQDLDFGSRRKAKRHGSSNAALGCMQNAQRAALQLLYGPEPEEARRTFAHPVSERLRLCGLGEKEREEDQQRHEGFFQALRVGDFRQVVHCVEEGADLTARTLRGQDVVMLASTTRAEGAVEVLKFMADAKIGIENQDCLGWTPLCHACRNSALQAATFLLENRARLDCQDNSGRTPLMLACLEGSLEVPILLIEASAQIRLQAPSAGRLLRKQWNAPKGRHAQESSGTRPKKAVEDHRGWTAIFYAAERGKQEVVKLLLRKLASPHIIGKEGVSALMVACVRGNVMAAKQLIRRRADVNQVEKNGNSALMLALAAAQQDLSAWLLQEDVDVDLSNALGETAYDIAAEQGFNSLKSTIIMISRKREEAQRKASLEAAALALGQD
ncbi:unnamed protein product [Effrenium voratum]|uniref:Uncharacterized protein n=1 Tax=Effrenium voratum TaxID=2562239 RepID=A0AA36I6K0_9DINO|nr:unnamed protein product [Effrenium voratum]CAJ1439215.1 unnamed protein product [Effrenium voratum]